MNRRTRLTLAIITALLVLAVQPGGLEAQLPAPNATGVATGHIHLNVADVEAQKALWLDLGAEVTSTGGLELLRIPGMYLILRDRPADGPSAGSAVHHFGFWVNDHSAIREKLLAHDMNVIADNVDNKQIVILFPDGALIEFTENESTTVPIEFHHIHLEGTEKEEIRDWYVKTFGAESGSRADWASAMVPGGRIDVRAVDEAMEPTQGRAIDHIGFEVADMDAFAAKMRAEGIEFDVEPREIPQIELKIAFITDPIGTYIEITEGLAGK